MGIPIKCHRCTTKNGILQEECRKCGTAINRSGIISRVRIAGGSVPSAAWETEAIPDIWRNSEPQDGTPEDLNSHDFLSYCLLLKSMSRQFDKNDKTLWFDDALFFLRGGYDFFCHLNLTSDMSLRGRIFGGLNHGKRPAIRLRVWLTKLIDEAVARDADRLDIFVGEEVNSGSSAHRIVNIIRNHLDKQQPRVSYTDLRFHFYLACGDTSIFNPKEFEKAIASNRRYNSGNLQVTNEFRIFRGPLLSYDAEKFSGLKLTSRGDQEIESYLPIRYRTPYFKITCPKTNTNIYSCAPGMNDLDNLVGILVVNLLNRERDLIYNRMESNISESCAECRRLFSQLHSTEDSWESYFLFGADFDECVRTRAYFLWKNKQGYHWSDPFSNWLEAERYEKKRKN